MDNGSLKTKWKSLFCAIHKITYFKNLYVYGNRFIGQPLIVSTNFDTIYFDLGEMMNDYIQ